MYAILEIGGRQYQVKVGQKIMVNRIQAEEDTPVSLKGLLLLKSGDAVKTSSGDLSQASVRALVKRNLRGKKIRVFKTKRRTGFQKTRGHRQELTELLITDIFDGPASAESAESSLSASSDNPEASAGAEAAENASASESPEAASDEAAESAAASEGAGSEAPQSESESDSAETPQSEDAGAEDKKEEV